MNADLAHVADARAQIAADAEALKVLVRELVDEPRPREPHLGADDGDLVRDGPIHASLGGGHAALRGGHGRQLALRDGPFLCPRMGAPTILAQLDVLGSHDRAHCALAAAAGGRTFEGLAAISSAAASVIEVKMRC